MRPPIRHQIAAPDHHASARHLAGTDALRLISISHRTAPLADLERMALSSAMRTRLYDEFHRLGLEAVVLGTCNRTELYWSSRHAGDDAVAEAAFSFSALPGPPLRHESFVREHGSAAAMHLFRVVAGLESLVVGEAEILGQARAAIDDAEASGSPGLFLSGLFRAALRFGGRARSETRIGAGALSVASAAVQLLGRVHEDLSDLTVVVIGAGVTGLKVARHLKAERIGRLVLVNRTLQRAEEAAAELLAMAAPLEELAYWLARADAVIAAVQVERPVVTPELLRAALPKHRERSLVLIDLSLPRAIDPGCAAVAGVALRDLSGLEQIVVHNRARREREIPRVEALLEHELEIFQQQVRESMVRPLVAELRRHADAIRREELARTLQDGKCDAQALDQLTRRVVDRLLHAPSLALRRGELSLDPPHARYLRLLFGLEDEHGEAT